LLYAEAGEVKKTEKEW